MGPACSEILHPGAEHHSASRGSWRPGLLPRIHERRHGTGHQRRENTDQYREHRSDIPVPAEHQECAHYFYDPGREQRSGDQEKHSSYDDRDGPVAKQLGVVMKIMKSTIRSKRERGVAMLVALLSLLLLAAIGMGLMFMADTENSVNNNYRDAQKAYFAARAGAEDARLLLVRDSTLNANALALNTNSPFKMLYLKNPTNSETIDPTTAAGNTLATNPYLDDQLCWERYANLTLTPSAGPCGSNGQSGQLLTDSTAFTASTMTQSAGVNGADAL